MHTFSTPQEVLCFIKECLAHEAGASRLYAVVQEPVVGSWRASIFIDLREIETGEGLEAVFLQGNEFPADAQTFHMGECSIRTRHLHLDLVRGADGWVLQRIWKCR